MRFVWLDEWYPEAFAAAGGQRSSYRELFDFCHGTADYWDVALRAAGHESETLIYNLETDCIGKAMQMQPDVICVQNIGLWQPHLIRARGYRGKLAGFCSYSSLGENFIGWDMIFTSFPWLAERLNADGRRATLLPLAFGRPVLERTAYDGPRDIPVAFFGGLGSRTWRNGTATMAAIAEQIPEFQWWGYMIERLPEPLIRTYRGPAWGRVYFKLLQRSQIVLNRHGEIAKGYGNNMRQYEVPGCGARLVTDCNGVFESSGYDSAESAVQVIKTILDECDPVPQQILREYVLQNHCYENRVPQFLQALETA